MTFSQIDYRRIDMDDLRRRLAALLERLTNAKTFEEAEQAFLEENEAEGETIRTMRTVAQIRRDIDTRDEFYDGEMAFYHQELPKLQPLKQEWTKASPFSGK